MHTRYLLQICLECQPWQMCRLLSNPPFAVRKSDLAIEFGWTPGGYNDGIKGGRMFRFWFMKTCGIREGETNTSLSHMRQLPNIQVEQCAHFLMNTVGLSGVCFRFFFVGVVVVVVLTLLHIYAEQRNFGKIKQYWFKCTWNFLNFFLFWFSQLAVQF